MSVLLAEVLVSDVVFEILFLSLSLIHFYLFSNPVQTALEELSTIKEKPMDPTARHREKVFSWCKTFTRPRNHLTD